MENMDKFIYELDNHGFNFEDKTYTEFGFNNEVLNMVYEMWQAGFNLGLEESSDNIEADKRLSTQKRISVNLEDL